jgi:hypothetical protein
MELSDLGGDSVHDRNIQEHQHPLSDYQRWLNELALAEDGTESEACLSPDWSGDPSARMDMDPDLLDQEDDAAEPDQIQELGTFRRLLDAALSSADNMLFGSDELAQVRDQIDILREEIAELHLETREQAESVRAMLDQMRDASERVGRKDWLLLGVGAAATLVITEVVPPLAMLHLGVKAIHALGPLFTR